MALNKTAVGAAAGVLAIAAGIVANFEGLRLHTYADVLGVPTICYGHTGPDVKTGDSKTPDECKALLIGDVASANATVHRCITVTMTQGQEAALTSATYNVGPSIVCGSTLQRYANAGQWPAACAQLDRWVYGGGKVLSGLVKRRAAERTMCEGKAS